MITWAGSLSMTIDALKHLHPQWVMVDDCLITVASSYLAGMILAEIFGGGASTILTSFIDMVNDWPTKKNDWPTKKVP